jgi:hypothetical protein
MNREGVIFVLCQILAITRGQWHRILRNWRTCSTGNHPGPCIPRKSGSLTFHFAEAYC